jgi:hypothetical protein
VKPHSQSAKEYRIRAQEHLAQMKEQLMNTQDEKNDKIIIKTMRWDEGVIQSELCNNSARKIVLAQHTLLPLYQKKIIDHIKKHIHIMHCPTALDSRLALVFNFLGPIIETPYERAFSKHIFDKTGTFTLNPRLVQSAPRALSHHVDFVLTDDQNTIHIYDTRYVENDFQGISIKKETSRKRYDMLKQRWQGHTLIYNDSDHGKIRYNLLEAYIDGLVFDKPDKNSISFLRNEQLMRDFYYTLFILANGEIKERDRIGSLNIIMSTHNRTHNRRYERFIGHVKADYRAYIHRYHWEKLIERAIEFSLMVHDEKLQAHYEMMKATFMNINE